MFNYRLIKFPPRHEKPRLDAKVHISREITKLLGIFYEKSTKKKYSTDLYLTFFAKNLHESFVVSGKFPTFANREVERITNYELQITILQMAK